MEAPEAWLEALGGRLIAWPMKPGTTTWRLEERPLMEHFLSLEAEVLLLSG